LGWEPPYPRKFWSEATLRRESWWLHSASCRSIAQSTCLSTGKPAIARLSNSLSAGRCQNYWTGIISGRPSQPQPGRSSKPPNRSFPIGPCWHQVVDGHHGPTSCGLFGGKTQEIRGAQPEDQGLQTHRRHRRAHSRTSHPLVKAFPSPKSERARIDDPAQASR
jgi:hypothetical protein